MPGRRQTNIGILQDISHTRSITTSLGGGLGMIIKKYNIYFIDKYYM